MQTRFDHTIRSLAATLLGLGALIATNTPTFANTFKFTYTGSFSSANALNPAGDPTTFLSGPTPFTAEALFDDTSPNLAAPIGVSGFVAYSPLWATLTLGGHTYDVTTYDQNPVEGVTVAIFDNTTPFGPTHFATGFLQNPLADGAGFIGDWVSATPAFSAAHLTSTVFTDYEGTGYGAGPNFGSIVVPIPLSDSKGNPYLLTIGNYEERLANGAPLNTAELQAVPEPSSAMWLLTGGVMTSLLALCRRRK